MWHLRYKEYRYFFIYFLLYQILKTWRFEITQFSIAFSHRQTYYSSPKNTWVYIISDFAKCHWQGNPTGLPSWESHRIVHPRCPTMVHRRITRCKTMVKQVVTPVSLRGSRDGYCMCVWYDSLISQSFDDLTITWPNTGTFAQGGVQLFFFAILILILFNIHL